MELGKVDRIESGESLQDTKNELEIDIQSLNIPSDDLYEDFTQIVN